MAAAALLLTATATLPALVAGNLLDCKDVVVDGTRYNFDALGGPRSVHYIQDQPPSILNTTFTIDLCYPLKPVKGVDKKDQCPQGTKGTYTDPKRTFSGERERDRGMMERDGEREKETARERELFWRTKFLVTFFLG